jgi:tRNA U34 5-carboxymethylaminomethyl modifying enzyme MnmG/GidA
VTRKLSVSLVRFLVRGFEAGRMKTGTPPRVDGRSLDYSKMNEEKVTLDLISFHTLMLLHRLFIKGLVT